MITGVSAVQQSLLKYCLNGEFAIASGSPDNFTNMWFKQSVDYFSVTDESYWLMHPNAYQPPVSPAPVEGSPDPAPQSPNAPRIVNEPTTTSPEETNDGVKKYQRIVVSGKVNLENYSDIFRSFIQPLAKNNLTIEIKITAKSTEVNPLTENSPSFQIPKESAQQLGLDFGTEE